MRLQAPQTPGTPSPNGFEPPQQIVGQNRFSTPNSPFPTSVPNSIGAMQQMGMGMGPRVPGHPAVTAGLRLNIPSNPGSTPGSALPSPALTPRSEGGDEMDTGSSRGPTPGPDRMDGALTPDMMDPNKVLKRRTSNQQPKRRGGLASGISDGMVAKKRPRKGSRADDGDYDNYIDSVMHQLKNLPPMSTVEPKLSHSFNACSIYGTGEVPKLMSKELNLQKGGVDGKFGVACIPQEGDYYATMPFGPEPPVPFVPPVSVSQRGFYNQEFLPDKKPETPRPGVVSPDLFYSSSPEPDHNANLQSKKKYFRNKPKASTESKEVKSAGPEVKSEKDEKEETVIKQETVDADEEVAKATDIKAEMTKKEEDVIKESPVDLSDCHTAWYDLEPEDSDDEPDMVKGPPEIQSRPVSPENTLVRPIPIKPNPKQTITLSDVTSLESKQEEAADKKPGLLSLPGSLGMIPEKIKEKPEGTQQVTLTLGGSGSSKSVLKALKGLAKLLEIDTPKQWMQEDVKTENTKAMFRVRKEGGRDGPPLDLQAVLNRNSKVCRHCDIIIQHDAVKKKAVDLPFMSKQEVEESSDDIVFCDEACYFQFAIKKTGGKTPEKVTNLKQLEEFQKRKKEEGLDAEESPKKEEPKGPKFKGSHYKFFNSTVSVPRRQKVMNEKDLTTLMFQMGITMMPPREAEDTRTCLYCHMTGDAAADGPARLLNYEVDKWCHLNCALWSEDVYETVSGALVNTETALKGSANSYCLICEKNYATIKCFKIRCTSMFHLNCAVKEKSMFYKNKSMFCKDHVPKGEKDNELTTLAVYRRVYIERDENRQIAEVMSSGMETNVLRLGSMTFLSVGQLLPHQLHTFHNEEYIYPIGFKILRYYWSMRKVNKRCSYYCSIQEKDNLPEFAIEVVETGHDNVTFTDSTCLGVWMKVLKEVESVRIKAKCIKVFPDFINGEDLFGLNEPTVMKVLESLPGIESLVDYNFKYGRNPMLELPLAVNPSGSARSEPKLRTHVKRIHNFQRSTGPKQKNDRAAKEMVPWLVGQETIGPYAKNFVQGKASQYRKMKQEWRQNVLLARSKIQGLGLYAARDLEMGQMIIEYIGEVIRSCLTDVREKHYEDQNRGIYMFRLDDDRVVDATMTGGVARYINHSCDPNCVTETIDIADTHIIIFAARRINRGEELSYDYKFDLEDDEMKIPCACGAKNCRKWMN